MLTLTTGDEATQRDFEDRASTFSAVSWWNDKTPSINEIALANIEAESKKKGAKLFNLYEGQFSGRQLTETVEAFLGRLPPAATPASEVVPWIFVWNPYQKPPEDTSDGNNKEDVTAEGIPHEGEDRLRFESLAKNLLDQLSDRKSEIERQKAGKAKSAITKAFNIEKEKIVKKILDTAVDMRCTSGKVGAHHETCTTS